MKSFFITALLLASTVSFAKQPATEALLKVLPEGTYVGTTDSNSKCSIEVKAILGFYKSFTLVTASTEEVTVSYSVNNDNDYAIGRVGRQNVLFLQSEINDGIETSSMKIINANNGKVNVSIGNYENDNRERTSLEVSCNI